MPSHQISNWKKGFTLVEFLVVLGILSIAVGSTLLFLTSVLKGSNQGNVMAEVKQNGQAILDSVEKQIRNASDVTQVSPTEILLNSSSSNPLHIACYAPTASVNGYIALGQGSPITWTSLSNTDMVAGVSIDDPNNPGQACKITVVPASVGTENPALVLVDFRANQGISAPSRQDFMANVHFTTTVSLRKY